MPEYLAPGVFVEETSFRQRPIEGVSTSTTGMLGPTRDGPIFGEPPLLTSYQEFAEIYGGMEPLRLTRQAPGAPESDQPTQMVNYLAQAVRAYFEEGGRRLYVARTYDAGTTQGGDGIGRWSSDDELSTPSSAPGVEIRSRYPGAMGNRTLTFRFHVGPNILSDDGTLLRGVTRYDVVWARGAADPGQMYWVDAFSNASGQRRYRLRVDDPDAAAPSDAIDVEGAGFRSVHVISVSVEVETAEAFRGRFDFAKTYEDLTFHPGGLGPSTRRTLTDAFAALPERRSTALFVPIVFTTDLINGVQVAELLASRANMEGNNMTVLARLRDEIEGGYLDNASPPERQQVTAEMLSTRIELSGGHDGKRPDVGEYNGEEAPSGHPLQGQATGLLAFEDLEDISIVAAPGSSFNGLVDAYRDNTRAIAGALLSHCERMRYRVAVLDSPDGAIPGEVRNYRGTLDSKHGALYYPWVRVFDPVSERPIFLPPSGHVAGIYARNDVERGVHKAPANEVVRLAIGFELLLNKSQQEALNPEGINCLRFFEGRGYRVWGARATTSDGEWRYINLRRNFAYLGRSIELGTAWAVFEPNGDDLWANVRRSVDDFLYNEWKNSRLMGLTKDEAYFVRCDRTTMTQADIDSGRLVCLVGVALLRPAEFVIFRIGQKTLDFNG